MEIDRRIGGGIPYGTLMLVEGEAAGGKSTLAQQLSWGALTAGEDVAMYTTEQTVQSMMRQMDSLGLGVHFSRHRQAGWSERRAYSPHAAEGLGSK